MAKKKKIDRDKYKHSFYYKYLLKTNAFLEKTGVLVSGKWIYYGVVVGVVAAFGSIMFMLLLKFIQNIALDSVAGYTHHELSPLVFFEGNKKWLILFLPAFGALIAGIISDKLAPETKGSGTDHVIKSFHKNQGYISSRTALAKIVTSSLVIGTGGSGGVQGPVSQIAAGFASLFSRRVKLSVKERRIMTISGAGAGISAVFGVPLGGAVFAAEALYKNQDIESEAIIPSIISSIVSYSLFRHIMGEEHLFNIAGVAFSSWKELIPYAILGIACAIAGVLYISVMKKVKKIFTENIKISGWIKPAIGGLGVGAIAMFLPQVLSDGFSFMQMAFNNELPYYLMGILILGKILAASFTIGSGGSGGTFAPSLFIGAMLGGTVGGALVNVFPQDWLPSQAAFVVVGMGGFFAGIARVPIASLFMVSEMTKGYDLLVPMMLVSAMAFLLNRKPFTLYDEQVNGLLDSPAHKGDFEIDILEDIKVKDVPPDKKDALTIPRTMGLKKVINLITHTSQDTFPVIDEKKGNRLVGIFTLEDIREELTEQELLSAAVADDIADRDFIYVTPDEDLHSAMNKFVTRDYDALPILNKKDKKFLGLLTRTSFIKVYNKKFAEMKKDG